MCVIMQRLLVVAVFMAGLAVSPGGAKADDSLFQRLGGEPAIRAVVEQFVANISADDRINQRWAEADVPSLKDELTSLICEASGGPCNYTGSSMSRAHEGMNITVDEFAWTAENLAAALDTLAVPGQEKGEVLAVIGSLEAEIVGQ